jgi:hypothetical protein
LVHCCSFFLLYTAVQQEEKLSSLSYVIYSARITVKSLHPFPQSSVGFHLLSDAEKSVSLRPVSLLAPQGHFQQGWSACSVSIPRGKATIFRLPGSSPPQVVFNFFAVGNRPDKGSSPGI